MKYMVSRRTVLTSSVGLIAAVSGCSGIGSETGVADLVISNQTSSTVAARINIRDGSDEVVYTEETELGSEDGEPALSANGVVSGESGDEFHLMIVLEETETSEEYTFSLGCVGEQAGDQPLSDTVYAQVVEADSVEFDHNNCD